MSRVLSQPYYPARGVGFQSEDGLAGPPAPAAPPRISTFARPHIPLLAAVAIAVLVVVALAATRSAGMVAALWVAGGVAVAVWLRAEPALGRDTAYGALLACGFFAGNILAGNSLEQTIAFTIANMIEVTVAVFLIRSQGARLRINTVTGATRFLILGAAFPPALAALFIAVVLSAMGAQAFFVTAQTWWLGHALGIAVAAPFILSLDSRHLAIFTNRWRIVEAVLVMAAIGAASVAIFIYAKQPVRFGILPVLLIAAVRFRVLGATVGILIVATISIGGAMAGATPSPGSIQQQAALTQMFLFFGCLPVLLIAAVLEERDRYATTARAGQARAERASEGKSRLLANVAHEIKSPVGGIIGIGELWASGQLGPVTPTQIEMADMLVKTARQVETLAHDLLDVARAEAGAVQVALRPVDVFGVMEDVRRSVALRPEAQGMSLETECEGEGLIACADSVRLTQVLNNLAANAVKYAACGGVVILRANRVRDCIRIEIIDRGPGLSLEKQAQLFEPFNRLGMERSTIEGHGIGLALAKRLTELQQGDIGVISAPGEGAVFWVELPAA